MSRGSPTAGRFDSFAVPLSFAVPPSDERLVAMTARADERLRALPSVDRLATAVARAELAEQRSAILAGGEARGEAELLAGARARLRPSPRRVLNATGVIVHTNLGRAPLAAQARAALASVAEGYCDLELELASARRAHRGGRVQALLTELTGAERALVVNNGAAAVLLAVGTLAKPGMEVVVSRSELIEIGGGFRIPEVVGQTGARLVEVGTTNRTRAGDYSAALGERTAAILRVHHSNFQMRGFVGRPPLGELASLGVPVIDDLGSGALTHEPPQLATEPTARESLREGASLVCFSGDKLLGGPQAGILLGGAEAIAACRANPLARALRIDKLCLAALEATLLLHRDPALARTEIPVLAMLDCPPHELERRARRLAEATGGRVVRSVARVGGGALPLLELEGPAVALDGGGDPQALARRLREGEPAVLSRIHRGAVLLDPRTLSEREVASAIECVQRALAHG